MRRFIGEADDLPAVVSTWMTGATAAETAAPDRALLLERLSPPPRGSVLLATCHRVELYGCGAPLEGGAPVARSETPARRHLFRLAAGLKSAVPGEDQVLHQVREALAQARSRERLDPALQRLFEDAIAAGRRVRATLGRPASGAGGEGESDLAGRAAAWLAERTPLSARRALVAGAGTMGRALTWELRRRGAEVLVASRHAPPAGLDLAGAARVACRVDAIGVALRGPWTELAEVARSGRPIALPPIADLSSPGAVPDAIRPVLADRLLQIDDLFVSGTSRAAAAWRAGAERIVEDALAAHEAWLASRASAGIMRTLQARADERRRRRVERYLRAQPDLGDEQAERLQLLTRRIVGDLLHEPLSALRGDRDGTRAEAARRLFDL